MCNRKQNVSYRSQVFLLHMVSMNSPRSPTLIPNHRNDSRCEPTRIKRLREETATEKMSTKFQKRQDAPDQTTSGESSGVAASSGCLAGENEEAGFGRPGGPEVKKEQRGTRGQDLQKTKEVEAPRMAEGRMWE